MDSDEFIESISCGALFTIALSNKGRVFGCGFQGTHSANQSHEEFFDKAKFKHVKIEAKILQISAGLSGCAALSKEGFVYIWGKFGKTVNNVPKKVKRSSNSINDRPDDEKFVSVKVGDEFVVLLSSRG